MNSFTDHLVISITNNKVLVRNIMLDSDTYSSSDNLINFIKTKSI